MKRTFVIIGELKKIRDGFQIRPLSVSGGSPNEITCSR